MATTTGANTSAVQAGQEPLLEYTGRYTGRGWHVFPLHSIVNGQCTCRKGCGNNAGKHPRTRHGLKDATTDQMTIRNWWTKWAQSNIGIATGQISGVVVLDVDDKDGKSGSTSLAALESEHGSLPMTLTCVTAHGRHYYFQHPGGTVQSSSGRVGIGLDVRADGGYVVAPPSVHLNGGNYGWLNPDVDVAAVPEWLLNRMKGPAPLIPVGQRNDSLARIAGGLRARGMERDVIEAKLIEQNSSLLEDPLPLAEVHAIAKSIARYSPGRQHLPWFQFFVNDFLAKPVVRYGRDYQVGWFIQLYVEAWRYGGALPNDPEILWRIAGAESREKFERNGDCGLALAEFESVQLNDGTQVLVHPWLASHHVEQSSKYRQRVEAGAKGVEKRKEVQKGQRPVHRPVGESELEPELEITIGKEDI